MLFCSLALVSFGTPAEIMEKPEHFWEQADQSNIVSLDALPNPYVVEALEALEASRIVLSEINDNSNSHSTAPKSTNPSPILSTYVDLHSDPGRSGATY